MKTQQFSSSFLFATVIAIVAATTITLLLSSSLSLFVYAQTAVSLVGSSVVDVDRTRLWIKDSQGDLFRPTNASAPPLPRYADANAFNASNAYFAKHTALYDRINERIMVFGGEQPSHPNAHDVQHDHRCSHQHLRLFQDSIQPL